MAKFERNENGVYVCPECKKAYDKYNSFYRHYKTKHANSGDSIENSNPIVKTADKTTKAITDTINKTAKTVTKLTAPEENSNSDADNEIDEETVNTSTAEPKKTKAKRIRLRPVEPPVKEPDENDENEDDEETESWIIPGLIRGSWGNKQKDSNESEKDSERKYLLIRGII